MTKGKSRPVRWANAVAQAREAQEELVAVKDSVNDDLAEAFQTLCDGLQEAIDTARTKLEEPGEKATDALQQLEELRNEYEEWYDNMPQQLQDSACGEKLSEIVNQFDFDIELDLEIEFPQIDSLTCELDLDELESLVDEAESADLPLGFGKD